MYTGVMSLLCISLVPVDSAVACCCGVLNEGSYSSGFINRSGREPVGDLSSHSASCGFWIAFFKAGHFLIRYRLRPVTLTSWKATIQTNVANAMETEVYPTTS